MTHKEKDKRFNIDMVMNHKYFEDVDWDNIGTYEEWEKRTLPYEAYFIKVRN